MQEDLSYDQRVSTGSSPSLPRHPHPQLLHPNLTSPRSPIHRSCAAYGLLSSFLSPQQTVSSVRARLASVLSSAPSPILHSVPDTQLVPNDCLIKKPSGRFPGTELAWEGGTDRLSPRGWQSPSTHPGFSAVPFSKLKEMVSGWISGSLGEKERKA